MKKILEGKVIENKMKNTATVEITREKAHPMYKKLFRVSKTFKVFTNSLAVASGDTVKIEETRPISKYIHFKIVSISKKAEQKGAL